jgi:hypothetical protein
MGRGLDGFLIFSVGTQWRCAVLKDLDGLSRFSGGFGEGETPLPIPNRAVKPLSADGTWPARARESRTPPVFIAAVEPPQGGSTHLPRPWLAESLAAQNILMERSTTIRATARLGGGLRRERTHGRRRAVVAVSLADRAQADLLPRRHRAPTASLLSAPGGFEPLPGMLCGRRLLVDLPVDVAVVLDDQERMRCSKHRPGAARKIGLESGREHVFDCTRGLGQNGSSMGLRACLRAKIRIVEPFFGRQICNAACSDVAWQRRYGRRREVVGSRARTGQRP